ncbi:hypothetical protein B0X71_03425 [Planococcus lenghuensis]|uniref:MotA/TolQ/ExbB proton channel domain-containing protein n=1 Tax=Planococcus lenghuensis TaxID=2213202 RepID=A0A1Q2KVK7_9BACL|nr:hypothetical protein B0X71_03425 [Planococcus lenghuensis]
MFSYFEELFLGFETAGLDVFTNSFMMLQLLIFAALLGFHLIWNLINYNDMRIVKSQLKKIEGNTQVGELNPALSSIFNRLKPFSSYKKQWDKYYGRITKEKAVDEKIRVEPFFGYDAMHDALGQRSVLDYGGGLQVSLGVLGTFIGLAIGLAGLNFTDSTVLMDGVTNLIGGMKTAFYTSVLGVVLSIIWIFIDRTITYNTDRSIEWHINKLHFLLNADDEEIFLNRLEKIQHQQVDQMRTLLTDALEKAMVPFVQTIEAGNREMSDQLRMQAETSKEHLNIIKNQGDDLSGQLVEQITTSTSKTINDFNTMLQNSQSAQEQMFSTLTQSIAQFEQVAASNQQVMGRTDQIVENFSALSTRMESAQSHYSKSQERLTELAAGFGGMQEMMLQQIESQQVLSDRNYDFMQKSDNLVEQFTSFGERMTEVQQTMIEDLVGKTEMVSGRFEQLAEELRTSSEKQMEATQNSAEYIEHAKVAISELIPLSTSLNETVSGLGELATMLNDMKEMQGELIPHLEEWNGNLTGQIESFMETTEISLKETTEQIRYSKEQWEQTARNLSAVKSELSQSVRDFKDNIESGVQTTFEQFDLQLKEAVTHFKIMADNYKDANNYLTDYVSQLEKRVESAV